MATRNLFNLILAVLVLLLYAGAGIAQQKYEVMDAHGKMGLSCSVCHGDKNPPQAPETSACLTCHKSYAEVAARTKALKPNPHDSHKGEVACSDCHSTHGTSRLSCNDCHSYTNFKMK
jgi:hypothetical protein